MSQPKLERLMNLLIMLLSARRPLTVEQIREMHPAYDQGDSESFRRMFERDKDELRDLGVPLETGPGRRLGDRAGLHRPAHATTSCREISLEPDEAAAVALAARLWQSAGLAEASRAALLKLRAAGVEAEAVDVAGVEPRVETADPAFEPLLEGDPGSAAGDLRLPHRRKRCGIGAASSSPGVSCTGAAGGTSSATIATATRLGCSGSPASSDDVRILGTVGEVVVPSGVDLPAQVVRARAAGSGGHGDPCACVPGPAGSCDGRRRRPAEEHGDEWHRCVVPMGDVERLADVAGRATVPMSSSMEPAELPIAWSSQRCAPCCGASA